jgi:phage terminase small subunit
MASANGKKKRGTKRQQRAKSRITAYQPEQQANQVSGETAGGYDSVEEESPDGSLTMRETLFVMFYVGEHMGNGTQAAIAAGYSKRSAASIASEYLKKPKIRDAVQARMKELTMPSEEVLFRLTLMAQADIGPYINVVHFESLGDRLTLDLPKMKKDGKTFLIKKLWEDKDGNIRVELHDSASALRDLGRHHQLFIDRIDISTLGEKMKAYANFSPADWDEEEPKSED